jgi:hypothetical protein
MAGLRNQQQGSFESAFQRQADESDNYHEASKDDSDCPIDDVCEEISSTRRGVLAPVILEMKSNFTVLSKSPKGRPPPEIKVEEVKEDTQPKEAP